jgi:hypothetical protein
VGLGDGVEERRLADVGHAEEQFGSGSLRIAGEPLERLTLTGAGNLDDREELGYPLPFVSLVVGTARHVKTDGVVMGCRCHVGVISIGGQIGHHCAAVWAGGFGLSHRVSSSISSSLITGPSTPDALTSAWRYRQGCGP